MSKEQISQYLEAYNQNRIDLLDQLSSLDENRLSHKPNKEDWSILGIAQHLMLSEKFMLEDLPEPHSLKPQKASLKSYLMYPIATFVLNKNVSVPAVEQVTPDDSLSVSELRVKWDESQSWLRLFIEQKDQNEITQALFKHPFMGPIPTLKLLRFMQTHFNYHERQIQRRLASSI